MIDPPPARRMGTIAALMPRNGSEQVDAPDLFEAVGRLELDRPRPVDRGVVHQHPQRPHRLGDGHGVGPILGARDVEVNVARHRTELDGNALTVVVEHVADDDTGPFLHAQAGVRLTLAPGAAGDDRNLAIELAHRHPPRALDLERRFYRTEPANGEPAP